MAKYIPKVIPEPVWADSKQELSQIDLILAFQWYTDNKTDKDARKYLLDYLKKTGQITSVQHQAAEYLNHSWNIVDGWFARCISRGAKAPNKSNENFQIRIADFLSRLDKIVVDRNLLGTVVAQVNKGQVVSIQERMQEKTDFFIMELEAKFDDVWHRTSKEDFDPYTWMVENEVKPVHASKIAEYFRTRAKDWVRMIESRKTDDYIKESYPRTHKEYLHGANILMMFVNDAEKLASNKNAARKPRKKKPVSFEKRVKNLKFKKDDVDNKLVSIDPVKILGANKLWIFNVKTRKLGVYVASDEAGLGVKGSCIENYKYDESIAKTLRKPKDVLSRVLDGGKIVLRKLMQEINSKPQELTGRINNDTVLLRVE